MDFRTQSYAALGDWAYDLLAAHLPYSLPLLRRFHWAQMNPTAHHPIFFILSAPTHLHNNPDAFLHTEASFAAALIVYHATQETQLWTYSTAEDTATQASPQFEHLTEASEEGFRRTEEAEKAVAEVFEELRTLTVGFPQEVTETAWEGNAFLAGSVHEVVREVLEKTGVVEVEPRASGKYEKWLFQRHYVPEPERLPEGLVWAEGTLRDCEVVVSRTDIPRQVETLVEWPNVFVKTTDGTPIAWAFLGFDGSLSSLHCEPAYRSKGIGRQLAAKLLQDKIPFFGSDGWASADVSPDNSASRAVCKAVSGSPAWVTSWLLIRV